MEPRLLVLRRAAQCVVPAAKQYSGKVRVEDLGFRGVKLDRRT
jgi:hypothetical protein